MSIDNRHAELLSLAAGNLDRTSVNAMDARLTAVGELFPHLATVVEVVESFIDPPTASSLQVGHHILDSALSEPAKGTQ